MAELHDPYACATCQELQTSVLRGEVTCIHGFGATGLCELCLNSKEAFSEDPRPG